jgi:hypothetical protein
MNPLTMNLFSENTITTLKTPEGKLDLKSSADSLTFMNDFSITCDSAGLTLATQLKSILDSVVLHLQAAEAAGHLPDLLVPVEG